MNNIEQQILMTAKAVIFDMDGVITNTMPYHFKAWEKAFHDVLGMEIDEKDIYLREGSKGSFALEQICEQRGWSHDAETLQRILERKEEFFPQIVQLEFVDGALDFLRQVHVLGFQMALVTGTSRKELMRMLPERVQEFFSVMITGSDVKHGKPDPEPYLTALKQLNVAAADAFVIENAPLGIQSAKSAGLRCLALMTSLSEEYLSDADYIFKSFSALREKVKFVYQEK